MLLLFGSSVLRHGGTSGRKQLFHFSRLDLQALFVSDESNKNSRESNMRDFLGLLKVISWGSLPGSRKARRLSNIRARGFGQILPNAIEWSARWRLPSVPV